MQQHENVEILPYTPEQMCALVADIEKYPEFLPWCNAARIISTHEWGCEAELVIAYKSLRESYVSKVLIEEPHFIHVEMISGPFKYLTNKWNFKPHADGVEVFFALDFAFKSKVLEALLGGFFTRATQKMTDAFKERASELYSS